jgi:hypothetical protein
MELCHQAAALSGQPLITLFVYGALPPEHEKLRELQKVEA